MPGLTKFPNILKSVYSVRTSFMNALTPWDLAKVFYAIGYQPSIRERSRFLNPIHDIFTSPEELGVLESLDLSVTLLGRDLYLLVERLEDVELYTKLQCSKRTILNIFVVITRKAMGQSSRKNGYIHRFSSERSLIPSLGKRSSVEEKAVIEKWVSSTLTNSKMDSQSMSYMLPQWLEVAMPLGNDLRVMTYLSGAAGNRLGYIGIDDDMFSDMLSEMNGRFFVEAAKLLEGNIEIYVCREDVAYRNDALGILCNLEDNMRADEIILVADVPHSYRNKCHYVVVPVATSEI
jgi:hypothetical protein